MVDGFWEETIVANGFLKDFYNSTIVVNYFFKLEPLVSMVFQWFLTIEPLPLNQWFCSRPLGTMDFRWLMRKKDNGFQKSRFTTKNCFTSSLFHTRGRSLVMVNTTISLCQTLWKYEYFQVPSMHLKSSWLEKWHLYGQARAEKLAKVYINPRTLSCFGQSFTSLVQFPCSMTERVKNF